MSSSDFDPFDSDQEVNENHDRLLEAVKNLHGVSKIEKHKRSELALIDSKYHLTKTKYGKKEIQESLKKSKKKESKRIVPEEQVLPKPLEKPAAEKIQRKIGYSNVTKDLKKWNAIVSRNRTAECVSFPINQSSIMIEPSNSLVQKYRIKSELQMKMEELNNQNKVDKDEKEEYSMTLEEILQQQKEIARLKRQQDYQAVKAKRQNKIKSKKFHRLQRKAKTKQIIAEFEKLRHTDPEAALKKLQEIDNARAHERMTLRHKNTGKWAQNQQIRAKYDKETRQVLAEQLAVSRELTQKVKQVDSDEDIDGEPPVPLPSTDKENPWIYPVKTDSEITDFISSYKKYWDEKNKDKKNQNETNKKSSVSGPNDVSDESVNKEEQALEKKQKKNLEKSTKDKLGIKSPKSKVTKAKKLKEKVGTSNWLIDSYENLVVPVSKEKIKEKAKKKKSSSASVIVKDSNNIEDTDIDDLFDSMENKIQQTLTKLVKKKKSQLEKQEQNEQKNKKNKTDNNNKKNKKEDDIEKLALKGQRIARPIIDKVIQESSNFNPQEETSGIENITNISDFNEKVTSQPSKAEIDPNKFINIKPKCIKTAMPDEVCEAQDALDDESEMEEDQQKIVSEAFADDDVVNEFLKEKEAEVKNSQPEDIDLTLPGWGSWGGKNIKVSKRKSRRFLIKFPKKEKRKDENKGNVVIIEEKNSKLKKHLVSELPFPFTNVEDYEASMRAPIGRDFVPENVFKKLTIPAVITKMGKIIEPMTEDVLVNVKSNLKKRKKRVKEAPNKEKKGNEVVKGSKKKKVAG